MKTREFFLVCIHYEDDTHETITFDTIDECKKVIDELISDPFINIGKQIYDISICDRKGKIIKK